jgi:hypothetical protein
MGNIEKKVVKTAPVPHRLTSNSGLRGKKSTPNSHSYGTALNIGCAGLGTELPEY